MKRILFVLPLVGLLAGCASDKPELKQRYWGGGTVLMEETQYIDEMANGPHRSYYRNGAIKVESTYLNNKLHGAYRAYFENGTVYKQENYNNGALDGEAVTYCEGGQIKEKHHFSNGKRNGRSEIYYKCSGKLREVAEYAAGVVQSKNSYFESGAPK